MFGAGGSNIESGDFMFMIADIFASGVQGGRRTQMCDFLTSQNFTKEPVKQLAVLAGQYGLSAIEYDARFISNTTIDGGKNMR